MYLFLSKLGTSTELSRLNLYLVHLQIPPEASEKLTHQGRLNDDYVRAPQSLQPLPIRLQSELIHFIQALKYFVTQSRMSQITDCWKHKQKSKPKNQHARIFIPLKTFHRKVTWQEPDFISWTNGFYVLNCSLILYWLQNTIKNVLFYCFYYQRLFPKAFPAAAAQQLLANSYENSISTAEIPIKSYS